MGSSMKKIGMMSLALLASAIFVVAAQAEIKVGVLALRGAPKVMEEWSATGEYLTAKMGEPVTIMPLEFAAISPMLKDGKIDFVLANSAFYVEMEKLYGAKAIASQVNSAGGKPVKEFGGVILVRKDSPIQNLADLKGKKFMVVKSSSFGGGQMALRLLLQNGIDYKKDFAEFREGGKHDNVVLAVKNGAMDAGTVRTDVMEAMAKEGKISMADFRIINQIKDSFPFVHSTELYPEWPMAAAKHVDAAKVQKFTDALLSIKADSDAAKKAGILGWAPAADFSSVRECLKALKYGAFAN
ncbi:phosphate/phosphite/phosphonate ABC transporter substrate-binding protein [Thiovibrio frasassiensis]|uniref:Phosphate/phosphite/phosphonate ABC transporter substrate-binding protein n=1 Tax=Thiovibrio frasassiensis TaxID=2984131 RepID=A0A9X4MKY8_9BACT|nr:phosphate/phosphite/phosphonate ABC transporter substrate-binding protein [Thiovibrio frasassiensis]MDG4474752.1 phosphate/phosphite/phosphonate ABC transporter substrate-binding protein [Thiovibrio frasassiensis]